jgi:probable phosphoglycerate mutase
MSVSASVSAPLRLYFIRHGETAWSLTGQHTGRTDLPLTPHGTAMARQLAATLEGIAFAHVLTSPRLRARDTCAGAGLSATACTEPDLAEWDYGDFEGLRTTDIHQQHPGWDIWQDGCPGGERPADVAQRADRLLARLGTLSGNVALFSHGQFGRVLAARWIGLPAAQGQHFAVDPASLGILGSETHHPQRRVILLWNASASPLPGAA